MRTRVDGGLTMARLRVAISVLMVLASLFVVSGAAADVFPTLTTSLTEGKTDIHFDDGQGYLIQTTGEVGSTKLGAHADFAVDMRFNYGGIVTGGGEDPKTYPPGTDWRESIKDLVVEIPAGLAGNPNAIPYEQRCDLSVFMDEQNEDGCPDSATVGDIWLEYSLMHSGPTTPVALGIVPIGPKWRASYQTPGQGFTKVSLIKSDPEVPALIGVYVKGPVNIGRVRTLLQIVPMTESDLRLRTVTVDGIPNTAYNANTDDWEQIRLERMRIKLSGKLASGKAFMVNPTSCEPWTTKVWARAHYGNSNATETPLDDGVPYLPLPPSTITPDCSNSAAVPFNAKGTVALSSNQRDVSPDFDFNIENPGMYDDDNAASGPKKIVARVPAAINVDVQQLGRTCAREDFFADTCPTSTKVGEAKIETPLLRAGLTGDSYLVKAPVGQGGLPDLGLRVRGPITFTQLGTNRYTGPKKNEIETTFDNIPQIGFTKLQFKILGGPNGLLRTLACPTGNKQPVPGAFSYEFTAWSGATGSSTTKLNAANCFGIQKLKRFRCVYRVLRFQPTYTSRARVKRVVLKIRGKKIRTIRQNKRGTSKLGFKIRAKKLKKLKKGKHPFEVSATYDDGTISKKKSSFRKCK